MRILIFPLFLFLSAITLEADTMTLDGKAKVVDGDTISVGGNSIRLHGIDAPESGQTCDNAIGLSYKCGQVATDRLSALIGANEVRCEVKDKDRYGRLVAVCFSKQINLNEQLVFEGLVLAYQKYSEDFVNAENIAKQNAAGLWGGKFVEPWDWRRGERHKTDQDSSVDRKVCRIKGNISNNGKIYHTPESPWYGRTKINTSKGERWFCSIEEAEAEGWRAIRK